MASVWSRGTGLWVATIIAAGCAPTMQPPSEAQVAAILERSRTPVEDIVIAEFLTGCFDDHELGHVRVVWSPGRVLSRSITSADFSKSEPIIIEHCWTDAQQSYPVYFAHSWTPTTDIEHYVWFELLTFEARCLAALGYSIDIPSFGEYMASPQWTPYVDVPVPPDESAWDSLNSTCPQAPWAYGDADRQSLSRAVEP